MDIGDLILILIGWQVVGFLIIVWAIFKIKWCCEVDSLAIVNPCVVYSYNKEVNWFGAVVLAFVFTALCPVGAVGYWFYKLCTVGRK